MWLLDANINVHLKDVLADFGLLQRRPLAEAGKHCRTENWWPPLSPTASIVY